MQTSRIARETDKAIRALRSSSGNDATMRRSSRTQGQFSTQALARSDERSMLDVKSEDGCAERTTSISMKRKRDSGRASPASHIIKLEQASIPERRSPRKAIKLESAAGDGDEDSKPIERKAKRQPAKRIKGPNGEATIEPPPGWERVYNITAEMRKRWLAPVDTMGCESLAEDTRSPLDQRLQTLVALMLSSQTKDTVTAVAMKNLQDNLPGGFCLESLLKVDPVLLNELIAKVGFHNNKTRFIKQTAEILRDQFNGDIPDSIDGLVSLPGVGPKMAYLCMSAAWGRDEGIGVDVHVHRITNLWGWHKTSTPEQTRAELEAWLPREKWHDINHLLVGFGQTYCPPVGRKCQNCDLFTQRLCPSAVPSSPVKKKVKREFVIKPKDGVKATASDMVVQADEVGVKVEMEGSDTGAVLLQGRADSKCPELT